MILIAAALLGLLGSVHCVAMCGPLILAVGVPRHRRGLGARLQYVGTYHAGRLATYAVLGGVVGAAGSVVALAGLGRVLALLAGLLLLVAGIGPAFVRKWPSWSWPWMATAAAAGTAARRWQATHSITGPFAAGLANGLLPCGMVYAALATSLAAGSIGHAAGSMVAFGLGTAPALVGVSLGAAHVSSAWRRRLSHASPIALVLVGLLLVGRALTPSFAGPSALHAIPHSAHHPSGAHIP